MKKICLHIFVEGEVQGVCYRSFVQVHAKQHHITGWVKNLSNGQVEILACGEEESVEEFKKWLWHGPAAARVRNVTSEPLPWEDHRGFTIAY